MKTIRIEWKCGSMMEEVLLTANVKNDIIFGIVDNGVMLFAEKHNIPVENIEVTIFIK